MGTGRVPSRLSEATEVFRRSLPKVSRVSILDGERVRAELDRLGLTQAEFADRFHLREATVSNAVHGHPLSAEIVYRILLGLELAESRK